MPQIVPLQATPNQTVAALLSDQDCQINVYQKTTGLFMDVLLNGNPIIQGVVCQNANRIVRSLYLGFAGDFAFFDTQGSEDPDHTGLGGRFFLIYILPSELPEGVG